MPQGLGICCSHCLDRFPLASFNPDVSSVSTTGTANGFLCPGGRGHRLPAPGGRRRNSISLPPALDTCSIAGTGGAAGRFLGGMGGGCPVSPWGGSSRPWHSPSLHQEGVPPDPQLLFQVKPGREKAHVHLLINAGGSHVPLSFQKQGWRSEPALIHKQRRPRGQPGQVGDTHMHTYTHMDTHPLGHTPTDTHT